MRCLELRLKVEKMYALNIKKGTTVNHPEVSLKGGCAVPVSEHLANQLKHVLNVVIFDEVVGITEEKAIKGLYGLDKKTLNRDVAIKTYKDFMKEYKNPKIAAEKWQEYKQEMGLKEDNG